MAEVGIPHALAERPLQHEYVTKERQLLRDLESLAALLALFGEEHWARHFSSQRRALDSAVSGGAGRPRKAAIAVAIRAAYQGTWSVNDLVIHPLNGHSIASGDVMRANNRLDALRNSVYALSWLYEERRFRRLDGE